MTVTYSYPEYTVALKICFFNPGSSIKFDAYGLPVGKSYPTNADLRFGNGSQLKY